MAGERYEPTLSLNTADIDTSKRYQRKEAEAAASREVSRQRGAEQATMRAMAERAMQPRTSEGRTNGRRGRKATRD
jgi:hypothetical protein